MTPRKTHSFLEWMLYIKHNDYATVEAEILTQNEVLTENKTI